jgi:RHS repeat-associated protein
VFRDNGYWYLDTNGNGLWEKGRTIVYDYDNMPISVNVSNVTTTFAYDGAGARVQKTGPGGTITYIGAMQECGAVSCTNYIYAGGTRIAAKSGNEVFYYHQDHLGSTRIITDQNAQVAEEIAYLPFGATLSDTGAANDAHKYTGQRFDAETGLYFYNARYYDPMLGRFISADTIVPSYADPQSLNRYSYVRNNPLMYIDPSGHTWHRKDWRKFRNAVTTGVVAGAVFVATGGAGTPMIFQAYAAGIAAGATGAALEGGNVKTVMNGAIMGGVAGFASGGLVQGAGAYGYGAYASGGLLAGGAGYSYHKDGWAGLANFAGGVGGAIAGGYLASLNGSLTPVTGIGGPSGSCNNDDLVRSHAA